MRLQRPLENSTVSEYQEGEKNIQQSLQLTSLLVTHLHLYPVLPSITKLFRSSFYLKKNIFELLSLRIWPENSPA